MWKRINIFFKFLIEENYVLRTLGFLILIYFIWFRFIRLRLPREIPFQLSLFNILLILIIIISFIFILKKYIKPSLISENTLYLGEILLKLKMPLISLDNYLRNQEYFKKGIKILFKMFFHPIFDYNNNIYRTFLPMKTFYFKWFFFPRIFLLLLFIIDIFYFNKLYLSYIFAILSLLPILFRYFMYLLQIYLNEYIIFLETWYEIEELNTNDMPLDGINHTTIRIFLYYQNILYKSTLFEPYAYQCSLSLDVLYKFFPPEEYNIYNIPDLTKEQKEFLEKDFYDLMPLVIDMYFFNENYSYLMRYLIKNSHMTQILNIIIYLLYLICWSYILLISLHTLHCTDIEMNLLKSFSDNFEPFSGINLHE